MIRRVIKCPNCRSEVKILERRGDEMGFLKCYQAVCTGCDMRGPEVSIGREDPDKMKAKAAESWNSMARRLGASESDTTFYRDSTLTPGKTRATDKQISFARAIASRLEIDPPEELAKDIYRRFISTHIAEFKRRAPRPVIGESCRPEPDVEIYRRPEPERAESELDRDWGHEYCGWDYADEDDTHIGPP